MLLRKTLLLLLMLFCCAKGFAATFVVTSNADSGPGTLRDALTQAAANGSTTNDFIIFNLSNTQAGRTIALQSQLPEISPNVVIDASTQPGPAIGVSGAKVILTTAGGVTGINAFNVPSINVKIYGFYIYGFQSAVINGITQNGIGI